MIKDTKFLATDVAPNPKDITHWIDLSEDPNGGVIKVWDGTEWASITKGLVYTVELNEVKEQITGLQSTISGLQTSLQQLQTNISSLLTTVESLNTKVESLTTENETLNTEIMTLKERVTVLENPTVEA